MADQPQCPSRRPTCRFCRGRGCFSCFPISTVVPMAGQPTSRWLPHDRPDPQGTCDLCGTSTRPFLMAWSLYRDGAVRNLCHTCYERLSPEPHQDP